MERYESIETLAVKLNQPKLFVMSSKGLTTEDIAEMKFNEAEAFGFSQDEYSKLKTYLKNHKMNRDTSPVAISPKVSPEAPKGCQHSFVVVGGSCCGKGYSKCIICGFVVKH